MYGWIWRMLPGPIWLRVLLALALVAGALAALAFWVFPWVETLLPSQDVTVVE